MFRFFLFEILLVFRCSMLWWIVRRCHRPLRVRRSIVFPLVLFMLTTGLLYTLVERYTSTTNRIELLSLDTEV
jgi:hypothetical protein